MQGSPQVTNQTETIRKAYVPTPRGPIHYAEAGDGPPLILLSETPRTHRHFSRIMPFLSAHFRTFAIDTPGFGNSHALPDPLSVPALAECVASFMDGIGLRSANVFGIHTGNKVAAALGAAFPDRVDRLVLSGMTHSIIPDWKARNAAIQPIFDGYDQRYGATADGSHLVRQWLRAHATASGIWWPQHLLNGETIRREEIEDVEAQVSDYLLGWRSVIPVYRAVFDFDLAEAYRRITAPTLILELVTRQEEHLGPQAKQIAAILHHGTALTLPITYLTAMQTEPREIAGAILPFLNGPG